MRLYEVRVQFPGTQKWVLIDEFSKKGKAVVIAGRVLTAQEALALVEELKAQRPDCQFKALPIDR